MRLLILPLLTLLLPGLVAAQTPTKPKVTVTPLNDQVFVHTSYGLYNNTSVPSNGLVIKTNDGIVLVDTGWDSDGDTDNTRQLLRWVDDNLHQPVRLCIVTHAHDDKVGGIAELRKAGVRVVSSPLTAQNAVKNGHEAPEAVLPADTTFTIGGEPIRCYFPGAGHTSDNIVVWLPNQQVLYGGCLVKSVGAFGMGNLSDANLSTWGSSIRNLQKQFGNARVVVPGHDEWSDTKALKHTLQLLEKHNASKK